MSSPIRDPGAEEWDAALAALQRLHARLLTTATELSVDLARPSATWDVGRAPGERGLQLGPGGLPESERAALYASVRADLQMLEQLTEQLEQLRVTLGRGIPPADASYG